MVAETYSLTEVDDGLGRKRRSPLKGIQVNGGPKKVGFGN